MINYMLNLNNLCYIYVIEWSICKRVNDVEHPIVIEPLLTDNLVNGINPTRRGMFSIC